MEATVGITSMACHLVRKPASLNVNTVLPIMMNFWRGTGLGTQNIVTESAHETALVTVSIWKNPAPITANGNALGVRIQRIGQGIMHGPKHDIGAIAMNGWRKVAPSERLSQVNRYRNAII